jgi:FPC/CPF motif-containing protein YcgG
MNPRARFVHDALRAQILTDDFPCLGAKSSIRQDTYRFGLYSELGSEASTRELGEDLLSFVGEMPSFDGAFSTYIASFEQPNPPDEAAFERDLWRTLQQLHDRDSMLHPWDPAVSDDPDDARFSFSFAGTAFFVIGMHAGSSRMARRFAWPTLVFNPHRQFERMRHEGHFGRFQHAIRERDATLQGEVNPMAADFGTRSEAAQYSGRHVDDTWKCPFHPRPRAD